tara:strand:+ start:447 stop:599 length:153 start_codon:yes stop_codon:yes gene_type:complete
MDTVKQTNEMSVAFNYIFLRMGPPRFELGSDGPQPPSIAKLTHGPKLNSD